MKYILKKDLPNIDAGQKIGVEDFNRQTLVISRNCIEYFIPKSKRDLWIEEVKPREFWIAEYHNYIGKVFFSEENARCSSNNVKGVIKVREVL